MAIPKKIHYCWFGGKELPREAEKCIQSWKKHCPDYEIIRWDESNFDFSDNRYASEAYSCKRYSFTSDYARLKIIYEEGGIYLDTDVELLSSLDDFLECKCYFAIEKGRNFAPRVATGLGFGAEKGSAAVEMLLRSYDDISFILENGHQDTTACPDRNIPVMEAIGVRNEDTRQSLELCEVYPSEYFCPMEWSTKKITLTENTVSIHHYAASWKTGKKKLIMKLRRARYSLFRR